MFRFISVGVAGLLLAGCVADEPWGLPQVALSQSPDNPAIASKGVAYRSVIGGYTPRTPSEPRSFRDTGVEIAPVGAGASSSSSEPASESGSSMSSMPAMGTMNEDGQMSGGSTQ